MRPKVLETLVNLTRGPVARGSMASVLIRITALGLGFLHAVLMARLLGPEGYGVTAVAMSTAAVASTFAMLGFGPLAVREAARLVVRADWSALRGFMRFAGLVVAGVSVVGGGAICALALWTDLFDTAYRDELAIAAMIVLPLGVLHFFRGVCQGFGRVLTAQLPADVVRPVMLVGSLGLLLAFGGALTTIDYMKISLATAVIAVVLALVFLAQIVRARVPPAVPTMRPVFWSRSAAPFFAVFLLGVIGAEASTLMLGSLSGPEEAGLFQPIARLTPIMLLAMEAISMPLAPRVASCWEQRDLEGIRHLYRLATRFATLGTVVVVLGLLLIAPFLLSAFGREFLVNQHLLLWIGLAQIVVASMGASATLLAMSGKMRLRITAQCLTVVVQLGLGLLLVGPYGAEGATVALIGSILVWSFLHWLFARISLDIDTSLFARQRSSRGE